MIYTFLYQYSVCLELFDNQGVDSGGQKRKLDIIIIGMLKASYYHISYVYCVHITNTLTVRVRRTPRKDFTIRQYYKFITS